MSSSIPTILCVDDEPIVLTTLAEQFGLELDGYDVELAQDANEALEIVDRLRAAGTLLPVVISDHIMPGMKGDELLVNVHARLPETRTILLTGQAGLEAVGRAVNNAGLYRYLTKPWKPDDLAMTVREAVRSFLVDRQVKEQQAKLATAHAAALRFVPHEFLSLLGAKELSEVRRGDFNSTPISIYYSDIRSYTTLVESHSPAENLHWINEYLECMEVPIHRHGGFVAEVAGDAVVALFGGGADAVLRAGIESLHALAACNEVRASRGALPLRIGIGMNTAPCVMGVIGSPERLTCGVIGDAVNLAARVESLTKQLGTLLITGQTYEALVDPSKYALRYVDRVRVKGLSAPTTLYEVLDGLPEAERNPKLANAGRLAEALSCFHQRDLAGAAAILDELQRIDPHDGAVRWHRRWVEQAGRQGLPADWDGVTTLETK